MRGSVSPRQLQAEFRFAMPAHTDAAVRDASVHHEVPVALTAELGEGGFGDAHLHVAFLADGNCEAAGGGDLAVALVDARDRGAAAHAAGGGDAADRAVDDVAPEPGAGDVVQ